MNRLQRLEARRTDPTVITANAEREIYRNIRESESVRFAIGAMQPIDKAYTDNTFAQGDRVKNQLEKNLSEDCEYRYQGSTTNDTHIKARSDLDLLVILERWFWVEPPQVAASPYRGDDKADMRGLRNDAEQVIKSAFPKVEIDSSGSKSVTIAGGSLTRKIDIVPATWFNTNDYARTGYDFYRGVKVFDKSSGQFIPNKPFLHNALVDLKDEKTKGGMKKAARLMKSLKYNWEEDNGEEMLSSYDIVSIAYQIPDEELAFEAPYELRILESCQSYCKRLREDVILREQIDVPNRMRKVFTTGGATVVKLDLMITELDRLANDIVQENARSFVKLSAARIPHPARYPMLVY